MRRTFTAQTIRIARDSKTKWNSGLRSQPPQTRPRRLPKTARSVSHLLDNSVSHVGHEIVHLLSGQHFSKKGPTRAARATLPRSPAGIKLASLKYVRNCRLRRPF